MLCEYMNQLVNSTPEVFLLCKFMESFKGNASLVYMFNGALPGRVENWAVDDNINECGPIAVHVQHDLI